MSTDETSNATNNNLKAIIERITNQIFLFVIAIVILLIGGATSLSQLGTSNFRFVILIITGLVFVAIITVIFRGSTPLKLFGSVYFEDNTPVRNARIYGTGIEREGYSDDIGRYEIVVSKPQNQMRFIAEFEGRTVVVEDLSKDRLNESVDFIFPIVEPSHIAVFGSVYFEDNTPVRNARIYGTGVEQEAYSDDVGNFTVTVIRPQNRTRLIAEFEGETAVRDNLTKEQLSESVDFILPQSKSASYLIETVEQISEEINLVSVENQRTLAPLFNDSPDLVSIREAFISLFNIQTQRTNFARWEAIIEGYEGISDELDQEIWRLESQLEQLKGKFYSDHSDIRGQDWGEGDWIIYYKVGLITAFRDTSLSIEQLRKLATEYLNKLRCSTEQLGDIAGRIRSIAV